MGWIEEHGDDYAVPVEVTRLEGIRDLSWHNDTCPRFGVNGDGIGPNLWVDHEDPERREMHPTPRYTVINQTHDCESSDDVEVYRGDDVREAIEVFLTVLRSRR
jgi:hypothetical protein